MSEQYAARYPDAPGHRNIGTSIAAADAIAPETGRLRRLALGAIIEAGSHGLTTLELAALVGVEAGSIQPRTSELKAARKIADSLQRRRNPNGKHAIVWVALSHVRDGKAVCHG
ncbi:MAG: hypothetical protein JWR80_8559 [Bradyrhizobium sp.]|nr:hypothetical protein [Bradyrhizobium sp.]